MKKNNIKIMFDKEGKFNIEAKGKSATIVSSFLGIVSTILTAEKTLNISSLIHHKALKKGILD